MAGDTEATERKGYDHEMIYKIIVIGDKNIGKTTLIQKFVQYPENMALSYSKLLGVCRTKEFELDLNAQKFKIKFVVWDLPDAEFSLTHKMYYNGVQGILLGFDLTRDQTCFNLKEWIAETHRCGLQDVPIVLFGNKSDLVEERKIFQEHIDFMKELFDIVEFFETSALTGDQVTELFTLLAKRISEKIDF